MFAFAGLIAICTFAQIKSLMTHKKIISLLPAATEIIVALGLGENLVGRSHECDYPEFVKALPACTSSKINSEQKSDEIDQQVKDILKDGLSLYSIDKDLIKELAPDVIITQAQCDVCAVSFEDVKIALSGYIDKKVEIISLNPNSLQDILDEIKSTGTILNVPEQAEILLEEMEERINIIKHKLKFIETKPKVACIEWIKPLMIAGNWTPGLVEIAGGNPVLAAKGQHSSFIEFEDLIAANPEILLIMPCGFSIGQTMKEINTFLELPGWTELNAVKNNQVYIADGNQYFNRSGPRIVDSIEILAEIIHPKQFIFGYEGEGWIKFNVQ